MANPQWETDGYIKIARPLMEALTRIRIPGEAAQCLRFILTKTYGFHKVEDSIALSQFCLATNLSKPAVCRALNKLQQMNLIIKKDNGLITSYQFNKDFDTWKSLSKKIIIIKKDNASLSKKRHTKETTTKEINIYIVEQVINYLNERTLKSFRPGAAATRRCINARLAEGHTLEDFKRVIDNRVAAWGGDSKMAEYLRPQTLFGPKFEGYLNAKTAKSSGPQRTGAIEAIKKEMGK